MSRKLGVALAATVMTLAACGGGGDGGGRPSVDDISSVFQEGGDLGGEEFTLTEKQADCAAEAFHSSDLSDDALTAMVEKDEDYELSDEDRTALTSVSTEGMVECMGMGTDGGTGG